MKRILSVVLCLMLLACTASAEQIKVFSYTIPQLIARQLISNTSLRVKLTAENSGSAPEFVDAQLWESLKTALPGMAINGTYMLRKTNGNMQVTAQLLKDGEALSGLALIGQGNDLLLETDLLPGIVLAAPRNTNGLLQLLTTPQEGEWPSLWRMVSAIENAGEEYAAQLEAALKSHMSDMNDWLRDYTDMQMEVGSNGVTPVQVVRVPADAMKARIKQQLRLLYADKELLELLRQVVMAEDAQVYLEDGMLPLYEAALDGAAFAGEMTVERRYDADGALASEKIVLPFAQGTGLSQAALAREYAGEGMQLSAQVDAAAGWSVSLTVAGGAMDEQNSAWKGEFAFKAANGETFAARYDLQLAIGRETYDAAQKNKERRMAHRAVLTFEPLTEGAFHKQQLTADVELIGGASSTAPGYCNITLHWQDLMSDSTFTLYAKNNTSAALRITEKDAGSAVRLENLSVQDMREWLADTARSTAGRLTDLFAQCLQLH